MAKEGQHYSQYLLPQCFFLCFLRLLELLSFHLFVFWSHLHDLRDLCLSCHGGVSFYSLRGFPGPSFFFIQLRALGFCLHSCLHCSRLPSPSHKLLSPPRENSISFDCVHFICNLNSVAFKYGKELSQSVLLHSMHCIMKEAFSFSFRYKGL